MRFAAEVLDYLAGRRFSNGLAVKVGAPEREVVLRLDWLAELVRGKKVVHIGFADHLPLIAKKVADGSWLHDRLRATASRCLGIDTDAEAVAWVREHLGTKDVYCHDLLGAEALPELEREQWDYLILGEILEHTDDPVRFLRALRERWGRGARLVVTVPNAFELTNWRYLLRQEEIINTDHRYWFTPYTLAKVGVRAGWAVDSFVHCQTHLPDGKVARALIRRYPQLRESIAMIFTA